MSKSRDAFRTISEVSDVLDTPAHVLRFWESKFSQVKPVKRAGGRRYYRPADVDLLGGIKRLLHDDGMTIKGAQKLLREQGVKHVSALGAEMIEHAQGSSDPIDVSQPVEEPAKTAVPEGEVGITNIVPMATPAKTGPALSVNLSPKSAPEPDAVPPVESEPEPTRAMPQISADPSDNDSKAPARIFHFLQKTAPEKLAARAETIAPLLDRMQVLRDRVASR